MSVEVVKKIEIVALKHIREELLDILQQQGSVHIISISDFSPQITPLIKSAGLQMESEDTGLLGQIEFAINYLKRYDTSEKGFLDSLKETPIKVSTEDIRSLLTDFNLEAIIKTCKQMEKTLNALDGEMKELKHQLEEITKWKSLDIPLKQVVEGTKFIDFYPVLIPGEQIGPFEKSLESRSLVSTFYQIKDLVGGYKSVLLMALKIDRSNIEELLSSQEAQVVFLPPVDEVPADMIKRLNKRMDEAEKEAAAVAQKGESLLCNLNKLRILYDHYKNREAKREIQSRFAFTEQTFTITGWIMEKDIHGLKTRLNHILGELDIDIEDPGKDETPPVALKNNRFTSPFELITKLYDLPHYRELDPTPILAPFFFLFFGLCMTDLGYGLLIGAVSLWGLKNLYLKGSGKRLLQLFFLCGISTFFCGLLAGSWFGDIVNYLPGWLGFLKNIKDAVAILDPIKDPLKFLIIALSLGYVQVTAGICVQMYKDFKAGDIYAAFLMRLPWVVLLTSLILFVIVKNPALMFMLKWFSIGSALIICLCEGRQEKNVLKRLGTGFLALYGTVGYYADMLSYCRLLALGLATAVIANVVNQMAILSRGIPYIGLVFMVMILVGGHLFNLIINLLGAFVHTSRLQFVEFFTKFFEGGGKKFIPFARQNKYTYVE